MGVKPMAGWLIDLIARIEQLTNWGMYGAPKIFWLAGFTYPSSFLTALLQFSARKNMVSVDTLSFDYLPQGFSEDGIQAAPKEGAMIKNMILEGGAGGGGPVRSAELVASCYHPVRAFGSYISVEG